MHGWQVLRFSPIVQLFSLCFFLNDFELLLFPQFSKDSGKYIEERKLKVVLISPPSSPVLLSVNGDTKQDPFNEINVQKDRVPSGVENIPPPHRVSSSPSIIPVSSIILSHKLLGL